MTRAKLVLLLVATVGMVAVGVGVTSCSRQPRLREKVVVEVPAQSMWVDTGVDVTDKNVLITYESGTWSNDGKESHFCDGEGFIPEADDFRDLMPKLIVSNAPLGALIGKTDGDPFFAGNSYEGRPGQGRLFLSINDKPASFNDNTGSLRVIVSVPE